MICSTKCPDILIHHEATSLFLGWCYCWSKTTGSGFLLLLLVAKTEHMLTRSKVTGLFGCKSVQLSGWEVIATRSGVKVKSGGRHVAVIGVSFLQTSPKKMQRQSAFRSSLMLDQLYNIHPRPSDRQEAAVNPITWSSGPPIIVSTPTLPPPLSAFPVFSSFYTAGFHYLPIVDHVCQAAMTSVLFSQTMEQKKRFPTYGTFWARHTRNCKREKHLIIIFFQTSLTLNHGIILHSRAGLSVCTNNMGQGWKETIRRTKWLKHLVDIEWTNIDSVLLLFNYNKMQPYVSPLADTAGQRKVFPLQGFTAENVWELTEEIIYVCANRTQKTTQNDPKWKRDPGFS